MVTWPHGVSAFFEVTRLKATRISLAISCCLELKVPEVVPEFHLGRKAFQAFCLASQTAVLSATS